MAYSFLFAAWGGSGNLGPLLTAGRLLKARGHAIRVIAEPAMRDDVEASGFDFVAWCRAPTGSAANPPDSMEPASWLLKAIFDPAAAYAADIRSEILSCPTDVVLSHDVIFGAVIGAESLGVPVAMFSPHVSLRPLRHVPPVTSDLRGPWTAQECAAVEEVNARYSAFFDIGKQTINELRHDLGLVPLTQVMEIFDRADRVLLASSRAFDFPTDALPRNTVYVGPMLDEPIWCEPWHAPWTQPATNPRALISFSTDAQGQTETVQKVVDAVGGMEGIEAVVTTGPSVGVGEIRAADNVHVVPSAPHDSVMKDVSLVVTQGGHGTVSRALINGLPMLILPRVRDQFGNAARVIARGAGLALPPTASTPEIVSAIDTLIRHPRFQSASRRIGQDMKADIDNSTFVDELETLAIVGRKATQSASMFI